MLCETIPQVEGRVAAAAGTVRRCTTMRIVWVLPGRGLSGGNRIVVEYANRLLARGHEVSIAYFKRPWILRPRALMNHGREALAYAVGIRQDHLNSFRGRIVATRPESLAAAVPAADVVVATHWLTAGPVLELPDAKGRKFYFLQGYEAPMFPGEPVDDTWRMPLRKIVISRWLADLARERFGDTEAALIPNALDSAHFRAPPRRLQRLPVAGFLYAPSPWKGAVTAYEAIRLARQRIPDLRVVSFGAKPPTGESPLPPGTMFELRPPQERIRDIYASADVWLCPSRSEGFGLPLLEAMACRCPVVSTRCGGPEEFVEEGINGFLVDVDDAAAMADRLVEAVTDPARWQRLSDAALETSRRFNWDTSVERMEAVLAGRSET